MPTCWMRIHYRQNAHPEDHWQLLLTAVFMETGSERAGCWAGGTFGQQSQMLAQPLDILIGTPQKLMQHAEKGNLFWGDVQYVVLDEADTMFDKGFGPEVRAVLGPLRSQAQPAKAVLVVATLSKVRTVRRFFWHMCNADSKCPVTGKGSLWQTQPMHSSTFLYLSMVRAS